MKWANKKESDDSYEIQLASNANEEKPSQNIKPNQVGVIIELADNAQAEQHSLVNDQSDAKLISDDQVQKTPADGDQSQAKDGSEAEDVHKDDAVKTVNLWLQDKNEKTLSYAEIKDFLKKHFKDPLKFFYPEIESYQSIVLIPADEFFDKVFEGKSVDEITEIPDFF